MNQQNQAKWNYISWCDFECSKCGFKRDKYNKERLYPYCPKCGSKMDNPEQIN